MTKATNGSLAGSALHLLHRAGQRADELFSVSMRSTALTPRQYAVLKAVAHDENLSQTDLVAATGIDRSTLADIVRRLIQKRLLQRKRTSHDARMYAVRLTASGRAALQSADPAAKATEERLLARLPANQRAAMIRALSTIVANGAAIEPKQARGRKAAR